MAAGLESFEVFEARALQFGVPATVVQALKAGNVATMGGFAWCCGFQPGGQDEAPLIAAITVLIGAAPSMGLMSQLRRLFYECHTVALMDMRSRLDRTDEDVPRKLQLPERVARMEQLKLRYPGLLIEGELEFSYSLMDRVINQFEQNEVRYINLADCTRRSQELDGEKQDPKLKIELKKGDPLRVTEDANQMHAPLASDLEIRNAFVRRALAYDAGGLITYTVLERWIVKLFRLLQEPAVELHAAISMSQLFRADKRLWSKLAEATKSNIVPLLGAAKPLDIAIMNLMNDVEVTFLLLPMQLARGAAIVTASSHSVQSPAFNPAPTMRDTPYAKAKVQPKAKSAKGSAGKGGSAKGNKSPKVSRDGCSFKLADNRNCCIYFNSPTGCNDKAVQLGRRCSRGFHLCGKVLQTGAVCSGEHAMQQCPH